MSGKEKLERDYQSLVDEIERMSAESIREIREKASRVKSEATEVGESVERSISEPRAKIDGKKS